MRKKYYLTLDTETATLPFANEIAKNAKQKQKIAIAKPLVYDIGWVITDRLGNRVKRVNYLIQETFFVPASLIRLIIEISALFMNNFLQRVR